MLSLQKKAQYNQKPPHQDIAILHDGMSKVPTPDATTYRPYNNFETLVVHIGEQTYAALKARHFLPSEGGRVRSATPYPKKQTAFA